MPLVNLTPHPINLYGPTRAPHDQPETVIAPSGTIARVATIDLGTQWDNTAGSYELVEYGRVHDLPPPAQGTAYIVSLVVALAARGRDDLYAPYVEVRDNTGTMIGCRFLQKVC